MAGGGAGLGRRGSGPIQLGPAPLGPAPLGPIQLGPAPLGAARKQVGRPVGLLWGRARRRRGAGTVQGRPGTEQLPRTVRTLDCEQPAALRRPPGAEPRSRTVRAWRCWTGPAGSEFRCLFRSRSGHAQVKGRRASSTARCETTNPDVREPGRTRTWAYANPGVRKPGRTQTRAASPRTSSGTSPHAHRAPTRKDCAPARKTAPR